jgi:hypothetical protein
LLGTPIRNEIEIILPRAIIQILYGAKGRKGKINVFMIEKALVIPLPYGGGMERDHVILGFQSLAAVAQAEIDAQTFFSIVVKVFDDGVLMGKAGVPHFIAPAPTQLCTFITQNVQITINGILVFRYREKGLAGSQLTFGIHVIVYLIVPRKDLSFGYGIAGRLGLMAKRVFFVHAVNAGKGIGIGRAQIFLLGLIRRFLDAKLIHKVGGSFGKAIEFLVFIFQVDLGQGGHLGSRHLRKSLQKIQLLMESRRVLV